MAVNGTSGAECVDPSVNPANNAISKYLSKWNLALPFKLYCPLLRKLHTIQTTSTMLANQYDSRSCLLSARGLTLSTMLVSSSRSRGSMWLVPDSASTTSARAKRAVAAEAAHTVLRADVKLRSLTKPRSQQRQHAIFASPPSTTQSRS